MTHIVYHSKDNTRSAEAIMGHLRAITSSSLLNLARLVQTVITG